MVTGDSSGDPPLSFFVLLVIFGTVLVAGGLGRWTYFQEAGYLPRMLKNFFLFSTSTANDYIAAYYLVGGVIAIATGVVGVFVIAF